MFLLTTAILALNALGKAHILPPRSAAGTPTNLANVTAAFEKAHIVPDVLASFNPVIGVDVLFTDQVTSESVDVIPGMLLTTEQTDQPPQWSLSSDDRDLSTSDTTWVITIVDPDALTPQNPSVAQFLHFIGKGFVVDKSFSPNYGGTVHLTNVTDALVEFFHPSPPSGSDPHRYVVLVFVQPDGFDAAGLAYFGGSIPPGTTFRQHFNVTDFAAKTSLGRPVAGNFFFVGPAAAASTAVIDTLPLPFN